ncbi:MAG: hypothetical protein AB7V48_14595 [Sedimentibacter sp.]
MKRVVGLIIVMSILLTFGMQAYASDEKIAGEISPMYINLMSLSSYLDIDKLGIAACTANLTQSLSDGSCKLIMNLQKLDSDGKWSTIATWTKEGVMKCVNSQYRAVSRGKFRLSVTGEVYDSNGNFIESGVVNSITKTY